MAKLNLSKSSITVNATEPVPGVLQVTRDVIDVSSETGRKPDPKWVHTDAAGHFHAWSAAGTTPTLERRTRHVECDDSCAHWDDEPCAGYDVPYLACRICGEEIRPGTVRDDARYRPGLIDWSVTAAVLVTPGDQVTVRVELPDREVFGVAVASEVTAGLGEPRTVLRGNGEYGERSIRQAPASVQVDPLHRWGEPQVKGINVDSIAGAVWAGESVATVADEYDLTEADVLVACWYMGRHGPKPWRRKFAEWSKGYEIACVKRLPPADPPSREDPSK
jgi:uncharacterized protein (DUF433 family)